MEGENFSSLLKRIDPVLKRIVYRVRARSFQHEYDDLYQEALIHLLSAYQSGVLEDKTESYILQGCYFYLKNYLRTTRTKAQVLSIDGQQGPDDAPAAKAWEIEDTRTAHFRQTLSDRLLAETIRNNGFSPREKQVLTMCSEGLTTREMGARIGRSHVGVIKMMARIRQKCRAYQDRE